MSANHSPGPGHPRPEQSDDVLLLTPGPTPLHPRALAALHWPVRGHMDPDVFAYNDGIVASLHELYGSGPGAFAALLSGTGSLAMEAGFMNLLEPGERVLVVSNGVFGDRMAEMARRQGAAVGLVSFSLGEPVDIERVRAEAERFRPKLLAVVHGETSSGVMNPVPALGAVARETGALFAVDAVTTVGMLPFAMTDWGIDYAYTGSQKCLSAPPGLAPVAFSARAMAAIEARRTPVASWYSDALGMRSYWENGEGGRSYHHTVPVQLHWATGEAVRAALDEGAEARARRAALLAAATERALASIGFRPLVAVEHRLATVLALTVPTGLADEEVRRRLRYDHGISVAGGLGELSGRIWRLGLMGENARPEHYLRLMDALARVLSEPHLPALFEEALAPVA
ncbi:MAG: aminotransferase class V-fold PLP-dependent enzyme [Trueperaceae bacterium]